MDTSAIDLAPTCHGLAELVRTTTDGDLGRPTPCPAYTVADLVDHVGGLAVAFRAAATKTPLEAGAGAPSGDGARLPDGWRDRIAADLETLAEAWTTPGAYDGETQAGPVVLPAPVAALVALDEVLVHGWDLAVATDRPYAPDAESVRRCTDFVAGFDAPADDGGLFGTPVAVPDDASPLDRLIGLTGRDPAWRAG